jgi:hypothetical protein
MGSEMHIKLLTGSAEFMHSKSPFRSQEIVQLYYAGGYSKKRFRITLPHVKCFHNFKLSKTHTL